MIKQYKNKKWLKHMLYDKTLSYQEIADICEVNIQTIKRHACNHDLGVGYNGGIKRGFRRTPAIIRVYTRYENGEKRNVIIINGKSYTYARFIAEKYIRPLKPGEIVHHKDEDTLNDDPENLKIVTRKQHTIIHFKGKPLTNKHKEKLKLAKIGNTPWNKGLKLKRRYDG